MNPFSASLIRHSYTLFDGTLECFAISPALDPESWTRLKYTLVSYSVNPNDFSTSFVSMGLSGLIGVPQL